MLFPGESDPVVLVPDGGDWKVSSDMIDSWFDEPDESSAESVLGRCEWPCEGYREGEDPTYFDGESEGAEWEGQQHFSRSIRTADADGEEGEWRSW